MPKSIDNNNNNKVRFISENGRFRYSTRTKGVLKLISLV